MKEDIKQIFVNALLEAIPDQSVVLDKISDPDFFNLCPLEQIFDELAIDSLGRLWFLTRIGEAFGSEKVKDPEQFFTENATKRINEVINSICTNVIHERNEPEEAH